MIPEIIAIYLAGVACCVGLSIQNFCYWDEVLDKRISMFIGRVGFFLTAVVAGLIGIIAGGCAISEGRITADIYTLAILKQVLFIGACFVPIETIIKYEWPFNGVLCLLCGIFDALELTRLLSL